MQRQLSVVNTTVTADALAQALQIRESGGVPLIVDPRAPVADDLLAAQLPEAAGWTVLTSGTTGAPKIVVRTEKSWRIAFATLDAELGLDPGAGLWMPVHQVSSMALFSAAWAQESQLQLVIPSSDDAGLTRACVGHMTPAWLERLIELLEAGAPTTIHTALVGGDRLSSQVLTRARALGLRIVSYVGAAELSFVAWDTGDGMRAFPAVATTIVDGQLWVASDQTALEVIGGALQRQTIDGVQWATVGDRVVERAGVLEFLGRSDGAILTAGATVIPADVETVLDRHPGVTGSLVLGQPDAVLGQRVVAWVEGSAEIAQLRGWVRSRLPKAARPVQWHRVDRLARTPSGKIRRVAPEDS